MIIATFHMPDSRIFVSCIHGHHLVSSEFRKKRFARLHNIAKADTLTHAASLVAQRLAGGNQCNGSNWSPLSQSSPG